MKSSPEQLPDKYVCITGISSGLGLEFARLWRQAGWKICGISRKAPPAGIADIFVSADLSVPGSGSKAAREILQQAGRIDLLINNAGFGGYAAWSEMPDADWRRMMEVDLFAPVEITRELLPVLAANKGCIVNISSAAGLAPVPGMGAYSAAKFALRAFSETLCWEITRSGISVVTVHPGRIPTGFSSRAVQIRQCPDTPRGGASAAVLAKRLFKAVRKAKPGRHKRLIYPYWYRFFVWFTMLCPDFYGRSAAKLWKL